VKPTASLLHPPTPLCGCLFAAVIRDTRGAQLEDADRLNFFPASPLVVLTHVLEGELRMLPGIAATGQLRSAPPMSTPLALAPQQTPIVSWSPGAVLAVSIGIYPDAWRKLADHPRVLALMAETFAPGSDPAAGWERFCAAFEPIWRDAAGAAAGWSGPARLALWARSVLVGAALSGPGRSARSIERRIKRLSGHTRQTLGFFATFDNLHRISVRSGTDRLADLALEAGFSDQSHMGRAVRRGTGFSPARLNHLIATEEAFWCYRLLGEQF
jgi:AraC-like DNA-binding protein